ncbi:M4 family metallopeptidase [Nocardioides stalactiti]|uniref:M4 family metallopeptidase n=1 Tax=Nocardioides stalactiti TaxID=2755356 RepID=UPI001603CF1C|nr:M4 family metallopeptidase [Nocardioides stalactiti]
MSNLGSRPRTRLAAATAVTATVASLVLGLPSGATSAPTPSDKPSGDNAAARAVSALLARPAVARATGGQEFTPTSTVRDADGSTHVRMTRTVRGLPVIGGDIVVHQGPGATWDGASQTLAAPVKVAVRPTVGRAAAERLVGVTDRTTRSISRLRVEGAPRLVIDAIGGTPRLAWEFTTGGRYADGTPSRLLTYVDAHDGRVIRREERIQTTDGEGTSLYSGTVDLQVTPSGTSYLLKDPTRGGTYTTDFGNKTDGLLCQLFGSGCKPGTTFSSTDVFFGNGSTSSRESAGVDAQYGTNVTWDYYKLVHNRNGIFGNGAGSYNRVHYGNGYVNAFWDGTKMTYGDGDGVEFGPLVSLDVAGHEMSHGVTENTANLTYSGESGGLNEATSDIFGTMVEFYAANPNDPGDYYIGEEFDLASQSGFRRMDNPSLDGSSQSCWSTTTKNVDVHYSSGVGNHFFYLLAEGSGAKTIGGKAHSSPTCDGSTIVGIGRTDAERIWYRALTVYMTSGTTYAGARTATLNAATDLFGAASTQRATVAAAWSAVNVN